jgi:hypothetical protein
MSILGSDFLRQKHNHSITLPLQRYQIRAHYQDSLRQSLLSNLDRCFIRQRAM